MRTAGTFFAMQEQPEGRSVSGDQGVLAVPAGHFLAG